MSRAAHDLALERSGKFYIVCGDGADPRVVIGEPGGVIFETATAADLDEADKLALKMIERHYPVPEPPKAVEPEPAKSTKTREK